MKVHIQSDLTLSKNFSKPIISLLGLTIFFLLFATSLFNSDVFVLLTVITSILLIDLMRRFIHYQSMFILFFYMFIFAFLFFVSGIGLISLTTGPYQNNIYYYHVLETFSIFIFVLWLILPQKISYEESKGQISHFFIRKSNILLFYINILIMLFIAIFGFTGQSIFTTGSYGKSLESGSALFGLAIYGYFPIFILTAFKYMRNNVIDKFLFWSIIIFYILKTLSLGGRGNILTIVLILFILFFEGRISYKILFLLGILLGFMLVLLGIIRGNTTQINIFYQIPRAFQIQNMFSNQIYVIYSSAAIQSLRSSKIFDPATLFYYFLLFILSIFLPSHYLPVQSNLALLVQKYAPVVGGGLINSYFYAWFGIIGVIVIALYLGLVLRKLSKKRSQALIVYQILILSYFPTWFSYSPSNIFKLCVFGVIVFELFKILEN